MKKIIESILALFVALVITIEAANAVQFLPYLLNRRSDNHLDHHKLIKEINELELTQSPTDKPQHRATLVPDLSQASVRKPSGRKREFKLNEFTLDDLLIKGPEDQESSKLSWPFQDISDQKVDVGDDSAALSRPVSNCGKTRVAAGASGYLRLSCIEGTTTGAPAAPPALDGSNLNLLHQLENAQFRRLNSDFELLVDTLTSTGPQRAQA